MQKRIDKAMAISIHAPREGSDGGHRGVRGLHQPISIHAPREGSDDFLDHSWVKTPKFLSTLPVRGATSRFIMRTTSPMDFYPRSP